VQRRRSLSRNGGLLHGASAAAVVLGLLLATDLAFVVVHIVDTQTGYISNPLNSLARDRGYAEFFQYTKLYWLVLLTGLLALRERVPVHAGWLVVFAYVLADDAFSLHERGGTHVAATLGLRPVLGLRAQALGELVIMAVAGSATLGLLALGYWRSDRPGRVFTHGLARLLMALAFFAVGVDAIHEAVRRTFADAVFEVLEDGGEMIVVSLMTWTVFRRVAGVDHVAEVAGIPLGNLALSPAVRTAAPPHPVAEPTAPVSSAG